MNNEAVISQLVEAIGGLSDKYDAIMIDFLLFKARYEATRSKPNNMVKEVRTWGDWARQLIIALISALCSIFGYRLVFGK